MADEKALGVTQYGETSDAGLFTGANRPQPGNVDTAGSKRKADPVQNTAPSSAKHD